MIYTFTTNPAIDMNFVTDGLKRGLVNRTKNTEYSPNGKGINVSFVLKHFGIDNCARGFFGGFTGTYICDGVRERGVKVDPVWIDGITRINIFMNDGDGEFKFVNAGADVNEEAQQLMLDKIAAAEDMDCLSVHGSLSPGIDFSYYDKLFDVCDAKGTDLIFDISAKKLKDLLARKPLLIKPNDEEAEEIFGIAVKSEADALYAIDHMMDLGAKNVLFTMGAKGCYFANGKNVYYATPVKVKLLSSACAGDGALGAFLSIWKEDRDAIAPAMKRSAAVGANVAESQGLGDLAKVAEYEKLIDIIKVR